MKSNAREMVGMKQEDRKAQISYSMDGNTYIYMSYSHSSVRAKQAWAKTRRRDDRGNKTTGKLLGISQVVGVP